MKKLAKHIPNVITSLNLLCGCFACLAALEGDAFRVFLLLILAAVFDFLDGFAARLLDAYSPVGKELDSLSDAVSFGLAPSLLVYWILGQMTMGETAFIYRYIPYAAFLLSVFSNLRLAYFNVDERQTTSFIGLNTPANALFWVSLSLVLIKYQSGELADQFIISGLSPQWVGFIASQINTYMILLMILFFSWVMMAEVPMFSFKMSQFSWLKYKWIYLFILLSGALIVAMGALGVSTAILIYILFSFLCRKPLN